MNELCGPGNSKWALDLGCGQGRYLSSLKGLGWNPVGLDPVPELATVAKSYGAVTIGAGEGLPFKSDTFDLVISYITLVDVEGVRHCMREIGRVLAPGGSVLVANLNGFVTASDHGWLRDELGRQLHIPVDRYFEERGIEQEWKGMRLINFHRPMQTYIQGFLAAGLQLVHFEEPSPNSACQQRFPELNDNLRVPYFHIMKWHKPTRI